MLVLRRFPFFFFFFFFSFLSQLRFGLSQSDSSGYADGTAELLREYVNSALADTPAPGNTVLVKTSAELKSAIDKAGCGDTIQLQVGATFVGSFKIPAKNCDDKHWIIVRTSAPDQDLPAEGVRITPCYAGVRSLPGARTFLALHPRMYWPRSCSTITAAVL